MSALGQKQTFAVHQPMSALPPIATLIAHFGISALCQKRTFQLFDDLIATRQQRRRNGKIN